MVLTYRELKKLKEKIAAQKLKVAAARDKSVSVSHDADGIPHSAGGTDRTSFIVGQIISEEEKLRALYSQFSAEIRLIPDEYIRDIIRCRLVKNWSWTRIAAEIGGNNSGNTIRMQVFRYKW